MKQSKAHVIITGTSRGLGKLMALDLLKAGYNVTGFSRSLNCVELLEYQKIGSYRHVIADLSNSESAELVISELTDKKSSALILNAAQFSSFPASDFKSFQGQLNINFFLPVVMINKLMSMDLKWRVRIINISSIMAFIPDGANPSYGAAKAGVSQYIKGIQTNVTGNCSLLNVFLGPMKEDGDNSRWLKRIFSVTYAQAANRVVEHLNSNHTTIYIPSIWKGVRAMLTVLPEKITSAWIHKQRSID